MLKKLFFKPLRWLRSLFIAGSSVKLNRPQEKELQLTVLRQEEQFTFNNNLLEAINQGVFDFMAPVVENSNLSCDEEDRYKLQTEEQMMQKYKHMYYEPWDESKVDVSNRDEWCDIDDLPGKMLIEGAPLETTVDYTTGINTNQNNIECTSTPE